MRRLVDVPRRRGPQVHTTAIGARARAALPIKAGALPAASAWTVPEPDTSPFVVVCGECRRSQRESQIPSLCHNQTQPANVRKQAKATIDKLGVTGSSPVPPMRKGLQGRPFLSWSGVCIAVVSRRLKLRSS